jgi:hypothetical protein
VQRREREKTTHIATTTSLVHAKTVESIKRRNRDVAESLGTVNVGGRVADADVDGCDEVVHRAAGEETVLALSEKGREGETNGSVSNLVLILCSLSAIAKASSRTCFNSRRTRCAP